MLQRCIAKGSESSEIIIWYVFEKKIKNCVTNAKVFRLIDNLESQRGFLVNKNHIQIETPIKE
jgi:hypothetical protein